MDTDLKKRFDRIDQRLKMIIELLQKQPDKSTWMTAYQLNKHLGISHRKLEQCRTLGQIEYKKSNGGGWLYKLESIPEVFIKNKNDGPKINGSGTEKPDYA